ncbi:hypothetical protein Trydic_g18998 [Trypoxylus dichotomus]
MYAYDNLGKQSGIRRSTTLFRYSVLRRIRKQWKYWLDNISRVIIITMANPRCEKDNNYDDVLDLIDGYCQNYNHDASNNSGRDCHHNRDHYYSLAVNFTMAMTMVVKLTMSVFMIVSMDVAMTSSMTTIGITTRILDMTMITCI